jgi:hypothetical protein
MWRSIGFLMSLAVVFEGIAIVAYLVILSGGKQLRESGWAILSLIIVMSAATQASSMALVVSTPSDMAACMRLIFGKGVSFR